MIGRLGGVPVERGWHEANQRYLMSSVSVVKAMLRHHAQQIASSKEQALVRCFGSWLSPQGARPTGSDHAAELQRARQAMQAAAAGLSSPSSLDWLSTVLELSPFERDVLVMCAGVELDSSFRGHCVAADEDGRGAPTFSLAMTALPGAHWSALSPERPLRRYHLIKMGEGETLTVRPLRIDEGVLHYLTGLPCLDASLLGLVRPVEPVAGLQLDALLASMEELWARHRRAQGPYPVIHLLGEESLDPRAVAASACARFGTPLYSLHAGDLPASAPERETLARMWTREALLRDCVLLVQCEGVETTEQVRALVAFVDRISDRLITIGPTPLPLGARLSRRVRVDRLPDAVAKAADG
jgi:hypothetical protein